ncbi:MAG TPA: UDP-N-acetylmuramoyl-L-alanine--D-glutamate ligase [Streptosporangiaceae bacterium]
MTRRPGRGPATFAGRAVCVAGVGISGRAAARALADHGARVTVVDARDGAAEREHAAALATGGGEIGGGETGGETGGEITVRLGDGETLPPGTDLVVTSPGWRPDVPLLAAAADAGVEIIGEVELAWRLRGPGAAPWLAVTGTDGKTTAVRMLASMLTAAGHKALAVGNVGTPIVSAVHPTGEAASHDVLAVELSSYQLHWSSSLAPYAAALLNIAPDHLDWHGSMDAYVAAKTKIFGPGTIAVYNADDERATAAATASGAARRVGCTLAPPGPGQLGVAGEALVDRAFGGAAGRGEEAGAELAALTDVRPFAPHNVANALAAAALARAYGVAAEAVRDGLRAFEPDPHRIQHVADIDGVAYVNDSKATQPHAAAASLAAYPSVVWIAGGLLKGLDVDELVRSHAARLRGVVLIGRDRGRIAEALGRHAPNVPVVDVPDTDTGAMDRAVRHAARLAGRGDTVLLAPAGASFDMFANYSGRGEAFIAAVGLLRAGAR